VNVKERDSRLIPWQWTRLGEQRKRLLLNGKGLKVQKEATVKEEGEETRLC
jgi:hypothetical protein